MPKLAKKKVVKKSPFWKGPEVDGVTQSLISDYLVCKERFRIKTIEGLAPAEQFNHRIEYGNMWHLCEENYLASGNLYWESYLLGYAKGLCKKFPTQQEQIEKWFQVCKIQFPIYIQYWKKKIKKDVEIPIEQEENFKVLYELPSGRHVNLRGKRDAVNLIGKGKQAGLYLQENKAKGDIKEDQIGRQLSFDLQTMVYLIALQEELDNNVFAGTEAEEKKIKGVIYNVIRRPLSGGKGTIRPHKATKTKAAETLTAYYERLRRIIMDEENIDSYFMRWKVTITQSDIEKFEVHTLIPILENLLDDYEWWSYCYDSRIDNGSDDWVYNFTEREAKFPHHQNRHYRLPFGIWNSLVEGGYHEIDEYLLSGSTVGLERPNTLFPELEE